MPCHAMRVDEVKLSKITTEPESHCHTRALCRTIFWRLLRERERARPSPSIPPSPTMMSITGSTNHDVHVTIRYFTVPTLICIPDLPTFYRYEYQEG